MRGEPAREPTPERPRAATEPVPDQERPVEPEAARVLRSLLDRIHTRGYYSDEVAQALGWDRDLLRDEEAVANLTHTDLILICEFISQPVAELWVELDWVSQHQAAESLRQVVIPPADYLVSLLADRRCHLFPHPVRDGWASLDHDELHAEAVRQHHYLTWFLLWLDSTREVDRKAASRRQARAKGKPCPKFKHQTWPPVPTAPSIPGTGVLDVVLPPALATRLKQAAERVSLTRQNVTPLDLLIRTLEAFLERNERKADRDAARQETRRQLKTTERKRI